ncbi:glycosyltransferase [Pseudomonas sp. 148P]|uniref:Glycosyltransferase n=1 Tax=Pseudomonas ulcerans TaxID=3115852 RepID=A0ABU7HTL0_9PSED|nr:MULTISPECIES: glycosyltransferase [unclassified Pseudomonas]MEE1923282.1 glycosyltransferase [Pseudomonas sp. 147P]MEE1934843.1 glycosyltransferase [Pseudomonas sp. 148P]
MPASTLHILVIGQAWPAPNAPAAGGHLLQILESFLARGWRVTFCSPAAPDEHYADLSAQGITGQAIDADESRFDRFISEQSPDVVLFDRFTMEEQFASRVEQHCPQALRVLEVSSLQSLGEARHALLRRRLVLGLDPNDFRELFATSGPDLYRQMAPASLTRRELAAIFRCDLSLVASDVEMDLLINGFGVPPALLHWCPPMLKAPQAATKAFAEREHFVFTGDFRHGPDADALLWLKHNIWPMIRRRLPEAQLHLHASQPSPKAAALHDPAGGFLVLDHAEAVLDNARVCLAPLRFGAGLKESLADALLAGTPSVTTPIGAEAMQGALPWPGLVSGTAEGLAQAAASLYSDEARWNQAQRDTRQLLGARYDGRRHGTALAERIEQTLMELDDQRLYNFTGAMLRQRLR